MIDGYSDTVKKTISVGRYPSFIRVTDYPNSNGIGFSCCKIYVANTQGASVSVIDGNNDTVKKTIPVGSDPTFILDP